MNKFYFVLALIFLAGAGWKFGGPISSDSRAMAVGMLFGIMAGIPALIVLTASWERERELRERYYERTPRVQVEPPKRPVSPPQIVHNHYHVTMQTAPGMPPTWKVLDTKKKVKS